MINHIGDCKSNGKTLHDEYLALAWIMLTAVLGVINAFWFEQAFSFSPWIKLSCSLLYSAFMVYKEIIGIDQSTYMVTRRMVSINEKNIYYV